MSAPRRRAILVTGVGGGVGQSILKALQNTDYRLVGVDSEELAAGLYAVPIAYKGYYASDPRYIERLLEICDREQCGLIFPGHDAELIPLASHVDCFRERNIIPVVSSTEVVALCDDKFATHEYLKARGFATPRTHRFSHDTPREFPVVLKPQRGGARSRKTYKVSTPEEFDIYRQLVDINNCVVQEFIEGDEYTCGSVTLNGRCAGVIAMRRILRDGDTYKAFVERNTLVESTSLAVIEALQPFGACNVQLRVRDGKAFVFEINARCSGTTAARALAGFNEPRMIAEYLIDNVEPRCEIRDISILRYWNELVVANERIKQLREDGLLHGDGAKL